MSKWDLVNELHRDARKNFTRRRTKMIGIDDCIQSDLVEMIPYASSNKNMKYILTAINIFSKKAYVRALKNKTGKEVTKAMESILNSLDHPIHHLHVDMGKEYYNSIMTNMLEKRNINLYSTFTTKKAAICERFNRTLKSKMWKQFSFRGSYKWIDMLQSLVSDYNNTKHRTIKMKPNDVNEMNERELLNTVYKYDLHLKRNRKSKFKLGGLLRISKYKHIFEKNYTPNWTTELFKINRIQNTNPITYLLVDLNGNEIKGSVYAQELQLVKHPNTYLVEKIIRKNKDGVYVKWLGFDSSHNSWVKNKDVI